MDESGNIYGVTQNGGNVSDNCGVGLAIGCGTVFQLASDGTLTTLYTFTGGNGSYPPAGLLMDKNSNLYGTTLSGGSSNFCGLYTGCGLVYELSPSGTETVLYPFNGGADGGLPEAGLIADSQGNLYGTTSVGGGTGCGGYGCGTVFEIAPDTTETILYAFQGNSDGAFPVAALYLDGKGNLYGTTSSGGGTGCGGGGCGTVFELSTKSK
jgi:uncharacterized repeat protein (TIGR03803 family)